MVCIVAAPIWSNRAVAMNVFLSEQRERSKNIIRLVDKVALRHALLYATGMLTVLIETRDHEEALARTLASLVGGAVDGTIREVIVCDLGSGDGTHKVAEISGCTFIEGDLARGVERARSEWLLVLEPGARLLEGWTNEVRDHAMRSDRPARFRRTKSSSGAWWKRLVRRGGLGEGLLITRSLAQSGQALAGCGAGAKRLDAEIVAAG